MPSYGRKSALNPPMVYSTDRSKAVVPVSVLLFVVLWFILRGDLFYVLPCVILLLGKRANLSAFCTFVPFGFVCFLFLSVSGMGCGL